MERQSTSKLFRALIAVVAFFVLCTSAILFASCGTDPLTCEHDLDGSKVVAITQGNCGKTGTVTYECSKCGAEVTVTGTLATGNHTWVNGRCSVCGMEEDKQEGLTLQQLKDDLTTVLNTINGKVDTTSSSLNDLTQKIVAALKSSDSTIPSLYDKLAEIKSALDALDLDFDFDIGDLALVDEASSGSTLGEVISSLYKQVNALYNSYAKGVSQDNLYDLLVGGTGAEAHVHNWVLELKEGTTYSCTEPNTYVWGCSFCTATKGEEVIVKATGHATNYKYGLQADGKTPTDLANTEGHYVAATCIAPARVEGYCANCKQWTGEWNEIGQPTYEHHYVKETEVVTDTDRTGVCTSKVVSVYHCETCGGAYVANENSGSSNGQHNYYYVADENGSNKRAMTDTEKLQVWNDAHPDDAEVTDLSQLSVKETQELNSLLEEGTFTVKEEGKDKTYTYGLNVVYYSAPTCVDPALIVVECMECGVRYAHTAGQPEGHEFEQVRPEVNATCTMDGTEDYYYCKKCGYYFFFNDGEYTVKTVGGKVVAEPSKDSLWYTRNYMTGLDGKVINDTSKDWKENKKAYDMATAKKPVEGHNFVPVYINNEKCVTAQDYVLVCKTCFKSGTKTFDQLVQTGNTEVAGALFYRESATSTVYYLKGLTGDNTNATALATLLSDVSTKATADAETSDLTLEWNNLAPADRINVFAWLGAHGYLVRDAKDDEVFGSIKKETAKAWYVDGELTTTAETTIQGYLAALGEDFDLATLYNGYSAKNTTAKNVASNMLLGPEQTTPNDQTANAAKVNAFELPVKGHKFDDKFVLVVGGCVMYERHVLFCSECGQHTGDPARRTDEGELNNPPFKSVTGDDDLYTAGFKGDTAQHTVPAAGYKTDLDLSWDAVCALNDQTGGAQFIWLTKYGYLNDYRDSDSTVDWSKIDPLLGIEGLMELDDEYAHYMEVSKVMERAGSLAQVEGITDFFTHKNVLEEYEVLNTFKAGAMTPVVLGHTFDAVTLLAAEECDAPGQYVYICSACGLKANTTIGSDKLTYQSGSNSVETGLKQVVESKRDYKTDQELFEAAIDEVNRGEGKTYTKTDLQLEWEALTVMNTAGTAVDAAKTEAAQFDWLLNHGYLNNIIDTYYTDGYKIGETLKGGYLATEVAKLQEGAQFATTGLYTAARGQVYKNGKLSLTEAQKADILAIAKDLAKKAAHTVTGGTDGDITVYYTHSADTYTKLVEEVETDVKDQPANKTIDFAATTVPVAGHLWRRGNGSVINLVTDPLCTDYASEELKVFYDNNYMVKWVEPDLDTTPNATSKYKVNPNYDPKAPFTPGKAHYLKGTADAGWVPAGTFNKDHLSTEFKNEVEEYGILGACGRENCPHHTKYTLSTGAYTGEDTFTAGYYAATDHVMSYEKYEASSVTGYPTTDIETYPKDGEDVHVYYNLNKVDTYRTAKKASKYLAAGESWETFAATEVSTSATAEAKAAAKKKLDDAAQKAMDADLLNLYTLQKIWNSLFIPTEWLNPTDEATKTARQTKYPTMDLPMSGSSVNLEALQGLFDEVNVPILWEQISNGIVSTWRPMNDNGNPSCWVSLRCHWYHYKTNSEATNTEKGFTGKICDTKAPENPHDDPYAGDFGYDTHVANCQHKDLCDTCGQPIGTKAGHKLLRVDPKPGTPENPGNQIEDEALQAAWIEVLKAFKDGKVTWLEGVIELSEAAQADDFDWTKFDWAKDWTILEDTCYEGDENGAGKEVGNNIYVCSGELEVIYKSMIKGDDEGNKLTWDQTMGTEKGKVNWTTSDNKADSKNNYFVEEIDEAPHKYEIRYYLPKVNERGEVIEGEFEEYTKDQWDNGWTDEDGNYHYAAKFDARICEDGYYTDYVCVNPRRGTTVRCGHIDASRHVDYEAVGHTRAPVENYWLLDSYRAPEGGKNASMLLTCVICGMHFDRVWGDTTSGEGEREQYKVATQSQINTWNDFVEKWNADEKNLEVKKYRAQLVRTEDVVNSTQLPPEGAAANTQIFTESMNVFKGTTTVKVQSNKKPAEEDKPQEYYTNTYGNIGGDVTVLIGKDGTTAGKLKFELADTHSTNLNIDIYGNVSFVGDGEKASDYTVDFSAVNEINLEGLNGTGSITFQNITVELGDNSLANWMPEGATLTFKNAVVKSTSSPLTMNATSEGVAPKIVIENSTFISTGDVGFANWLADAQITATKSTFVGKNAGAFIRGGTATFTECTFVTGGTAGAGATWADGTNIGTTVGALVVGNDESYVSEDYGNAHVTLNNCKFGTYTDTYSAEAELGDCDATKPAVNAFSSSKNETVVDLDAKSALAAGKFIKQNPGKATNSEGNLVSTLTIKVPEVSKADLGATASEQATTAATLVENVVAAGGSVELPKIDQTSGADTVINLSGLVDVAAGLETTVNLGGNVVQLAQGSNSNHVNGSLTLTNGTIKGGVDNASFTDFEVTGSLEMNGVTATFDKGGIAAFGANAEIVIKSSHIIGTTQVIATNNKETRGKSITIEDSTVIATATYGCALLVNQDGVKVTAKNTTFYGKDTAVWVRAGEAAFDGCTFISGGWRVGENAWDQGPKMMRYAYAALAVGEGEGMDYGNATVTITGASTNVIRGWVKPAQTESNYATYKDTTNTVTINSSAATVSATEAQNGALSKRFTVATNTHEASVTFGSQAIASKFLASTTIFAGIAADAATNYTVTGLVKGETEFGDLSKITVRYQSGGTLTDPQYTPVEPGSMTVAGGTQDAVETAAKSAIENVAETGGKVTLPQQEEGQEAKVELDSQLAVAAETNVELELNGNTLKLPETTSTEEGYVSNGLSVEGELTLSNGTVEGGMGLGENSNVTLNNVVVDHSGYDVEKEETYFGIMLSGESTDETSASLTLNNSSIKAVQPLYVNGNTDNATINLTNSDFLGLNGHGIWIAGNATIVAENCNFYGSVYAVEICSGDVTFKGCTFMNTNDTFSGDDSGTEFFQYGGEGMPTSTYAPLIINAKGVNKGYDMAKVSVDAACLFYNIDAPGKWVPDDVFDAEPEATTGLTEVKSKVTGETLGWVKLSTEELSDITLAYVKGQSPEDAKLTFSIDTTLAKSVVVKAFLFEADGAASGGKQNVKKVADWELADYFAVTGCTPTQVTE